MSDKLQQALRLLEDLLNHADEDCPADNRTKWFRDTMDETRQFLKEANK